MPGRQIPLDGPKARYQRIKQLSEAADYGLELTEHATAPFTVRWDPLIDKPTVCLRQTRLATVECDAIADAPTLRVRPGYPEEHDAVLLRALRNAADVADEVGRRQRAAAKEKASGKSAPLLTRTRTEFTVRMGYADLAKALWGAESLDPKLRPEVRGQGGFTLEAYSGNTCHTFPFVPVEDGFRVAHAGYASFFLKEDVFLGRLEQGRAAWDARFDADLLKADIDLLMRAGRVDKFTIESSYEAALRKERVDISVTARFRGFSMLYRGGNLDLHHAGIRVADTPPHDKKGTSLWGGMLSPEFTKELSEARKMMEAHWRAAAIGHRAEDYPVLRDGLIAQEVSRVDFGYDM